MTARVLIEQSLRTLGVLMTGEAPTADEAEDARIALNQMLDSWSTERLTVFEVFTQDFNFVAGQAAYTVGTGGDFNVARPPRIERVSVIDARQSPATEESVEIIRDLARWQRIYTKGTQDDDPYFARWDGAAAGGLGTLTFFPVPSTAGPSVKARLYMWRAFAAVTSLDTDFELPQGYERAIRYGLAVELAAEYGKMPPPTVAANAGQAKYNVRRMNADAPELRCDEALTGAGWLDIRSFRGIYQ